MKFCFHSRQITVKQLAESFSKEIECEISFIPANFDLHSLPTLAQKNPHVRYFVWAGTYRKAWQNQPPLVPNISFIENGYLPHYNTISIDPKGHLAESSIISFNLPEISLQENEDLSSFLAKYYFKEYEYEPIKHLLIRSPYILFPIQHINDSVIKFDTSDYCKHFDQIIIDASNSIPNDHYLVVKQHPKSTKGFKFVERPNVIYIDKLENDFLNDSLNNFLIKDCTALLSINSSYILEALVRDVPVISLGRGVFTGKGVTKEIKSINSESFVNLISNHSLNRAFLHELCLYRQVIPTHSISRIWKRFLEEETRLRNK
jgi:hypothetical protein